MLRRGLLVRCPLKDGIWSREATMAGLGLGVASGRSGKAGDARIAAARGMPGHFGTQTVPSDAEIRKYEAERLERQTGEPAPDEVAGDAGAPSSSSSAVGGKRPTEFNDAPHGYIHGRLREFWEYTPSMEHTSLILLLYRSLLKELIKLPSVRKRTFITYVRLTFRRRSAATEKLLIDECVEEARRAVYIAAKHNAMKESGEYKFDDMFLPKDTGQDVKTFMEDVYDPVMSKRTADEAKDVMPGKEHEHTNTLRGAHYANDRQARETMKEQLNRPAIKTEDMRLRPPPPPDMG